MMRIVNSPPPAIPARPDRLVRAYGHAVSLLLTLFLVPIAAGVPAGARGASGRVVAALFAVYALSLLLMPFAHRAGPAWRRAGVAWLFAYALAVVAVCGPSAVYLLLCPCTVAVLAALFRHATHDLRRARADIGDLAVQEERLRIARDLHDLLGHALTTIIVKTGLARKLVAVCAPDRVVTELCDVERLARETLGDVRATLSGYREANLKAELAAARTALAAACIAAVVPTELDCVGEPQRTAFAYAVREGVTNVIRHSRADRCEISIGPSTLEISDNGTGRRGPHGNGLTGLRERLSTIGAHLSAGPEPDGGYVLRVTVPN